MDEIWKPVKGYEGIYEVSNLGRVMSLHSYGGHAHRLRRQFYNNQGYAVVGLSKCGTSQKWLVHRLVATAFISNPDHCEFVNHKDENKANNRADNLEWCTKSYNAMYSLNRHPQRKTLYASFFKNHYQGKPLAHKEIIEQYSLSGELIGTYKSVVEASKQTGIENKIIIACCKGKQKTGRDYIWKFHDGLKLDLSKYKRINETKRAIQTDEPIGSFYISQ